MLDLSPDEITSDSLYRVLAVLSVPLLLQNLVKIVQSIVDLFWLGNLGGDAVAAVGLAFPISSLVVIIAATVPYIGTQVLVSQRIGSDDVFGARKAAFNGLILATILGLVTGGVAYLVAPDLVRWMTVTQPESVAAGIIPKATDYFQILSLFIVITGLTDTIEAALVARGDSRASFHIVLANVLTNAIVDPILIFGLGPAPALGVAGAAFASRLGSLAGLAVGTVFVLRGRSGGVLSRKAAEFELSELRELLERGGPPAAERGSRNIADTVTVIIVFAAGGAAGLSAYLIGTRAALVAMIPCFGLQASIQSVVGQNLGADKPQRAQRTAKVGLIYINAILLPLAVIQLTMAGTITNVLAPDIGQEAFEASVTFLQLLAYSYPALGAIFVFQGGFNGANRGRTSFLSSLFQYWAVQVPVAAIGGILLGGGVVTVFGAVAVANVLTGIALGVYYYRVSRSGEFETIAAEVEETTAASG